MRGVTGVRPALTAVGRITLVAAFLAGSVVQQGTAQAQGKWYRFSTGVNHNARDRLTGDPAKDSKMRDPVHFAEIRLRIVLSQEDRVAVEAFAQQGDLVSLRQLLKEKLPAEDSITKAAKGAVIDALKFRDQPLRPGALMGIDWVNFGTGTDYGDDPTAGIRTDPKHFAEIHLLIPLTAGMKAEAEELAWAKDFPALTKLLEDALKNAGIDNEANKALVSALKWKKEKKEE